MANKKYIFFVLCKQICNVICFQKYKNDHNRTHTFLCLNSARSVLRWHRRTVHVTHNSKHRNLPKTVLLRTISHDFLPNLCVAHKIFSLRGRGPVTALCHLKMCSIIIPFSYFDIETYTPCVKFTHTGEDDRCTSCGQARTAPGCKSSTLKVHHFGQGLPEIIQLRPTHPPT